MPPATELDEDSPPDAALPGILDAGSVIELSATSGLGRLDGWPVCYAVAFGDVTATHMRSLIEAAKLSSRHEVPLVLVQDTDGYGADVTDEVMAEAYNTIRRSRAAKLVLITGRGHALGDFVYGGRTLGVDTIVCWPDAQVAGFDVDVYRPGAIPEDANRDPLLAAGLGAIDDILLPSETRERLSRMIGLLAPARAYPSLGEDRGGRLIEDIAKV
jgi:acetyl-CoA carboxylase carboxyltransferase component